ncbi:MAG: hypothetical protein MHM6MM_007654 [Cercozoa sp. M6MM]
MHLSVVCDVRNPLCGDQGAAATYGPQKGATAEDIAEFDAAARSFLQACARSGIDDVETIANSEGAGAAGGLAAGLMMFFRADTVGGAVFAADCVGLTDALKECDLVLTGEGRFDATSSCGKLPVEVANMAHPLPVVALVGSVEHADEEESGNEPCEEESGARNLSVLCIQSGAIDLQTAMRPDVTRRNLARTAEHVTRLYLSTSAVSH